MEQDHLGDQGTLSFSFCLLACRLRYLGSCLAITVNADAASVRIHLLQSVGDFIYRSEDKRKVLESLIPLRWAVLEILRKSGRKRSQPRSVTTSWTESRRWFIYVPGTLLHVHPVPRPLITWAEITPGSELLKPRGTCLVYMFSYVDAPKSNFHSFDFLKKLSIAVI